MGEIEEVQERMKDDMEAMMSMKKIMEVNAAAVAATSAVARVDPIPPSSLNQINYPTSDMVGQGGQKLESTGGPHFVQVQNKHAFLPYGLPPNYTPPNVSHTPDENFNNSTPILVEIQQPQFDHAHVSQPMGKTHEIPHHNLADFKPRLGYAIEGQAIGGGPLPNTSEHPPFRPQPQPLHFAVGRVPPAMAGKGKLDHIEERLIAIEGGGDYSFADMEELCLVPYVVIPPKFKVPDFDMYKGTTCPKSHLKLYCRKIGAYAKDEKLLMHFFQESLTGAAVTWYTNLEPSQVHSLKNLMVAFIRQYQYNSRNTPRGGGNWQLEWPLQ